MAILASIHSQIYFIMYTQQVDEVVQRSSDYNLIINENKTNEIIILNSNIDYGQLQHLRFKNHAIQPQHLLSWISWIFKNKKLKEWLM